MEKPVLIIMAAGFFGMKADFNTAPAADEVESFTLARNESLPDELVMFRLQDTLGRWVTDEAEITDRGIIEYVTAQLKDLSDTYGHDIAKAYDESNALINFEYAPMRDSKRLIVLKLNLKNGKSIRRIIGFDEEHITALQNAFLSDNEFMKKFLTLPAANQVNVVCDEVNSLTREETEAVYKTFLTEYNALSDEEKLTLFSGAMQPSDSTDDYVQDSDDDAPAQTVNATDISMISTSRGSGQYGILMSYFAENNENPDNFLSLEIVGYPEGHLYQYEKWYNYSLNFTGKSFPETAAMIVRTCNAKFADAQNNFKASAERQKEVNIAADDPTMSITYFSENKTLNVDFVLLTGDNPSDSMLNDEGRKEFSYHNEPNTIIKEIYVDSDAMVRRVLNDVPSTETIDFTKPYARVKWYHYCGRKMEILTFYAQTENPVDYLHLMDSDRAKQEAKGKKK